MAGKKIKGLRWYIDIMLFFACVICYLDRNTLTIVAKTMMEDLGINEIGYGQVTSVFYWTYAIAYTLGGYFMVRVGTRTGFNIIMIVWSLASILHATVRSAFQLGFWRFMLAVGEGGTYPGATKVTAEWFPPKERATAVGYFNSGSMIGALVAPPVVAYITHRWGWQEAFIVTGALGFIWLIFWWLLYFIPEKHPRITDEELDYIKREGGGTIDVKTKVPIMKFFTFSETWALFIARFLGDQVWYFYAAWIGLILQKIYGYDIMDLGKFLWIPFAAASAGSLAGGFTSSFLIKKGWKPLSARKATVFFYSLIMPITILGGYTEHSYIFMITASLACFAHTAWVANIHAISMDCFPTKFVAFPAGWGGTGGSIGGAISNLIIGYIVVKYGGYGPVITIYGFFHLLSTAAIYLLARKRNLTEEEMATA